MRTTQLAGRWFALLWSVPRRRFALALAAPIALLGAAAAPSMQAQAAFSCSYSDASSTNVTVHDPAITYILSGQEHAGWYGGNTVQPLSNGVSAAGIEAQCLLLKAGFNPGTIDGVFGPNSQAAARSFQATINSSTGAGIGVDGLVGPQTWPWLRYWSQ